MAKGKQVSVVEAKKSLSDLLGRVAYGRESITILKRGRPMARLVPVESKPLSSLAHVKGWLPDNDPFFGIMDEIVAQRHTRPARANCSQASLRPVRKSTSKTS